MGGAKVKQDKQQRMMSSRRRQRRGRRAQLQASPEKPKVVERILLGDLVYFVMVHSGRYDDTLGEITGVYRTFEEAMRQADSEFSSGPPRVSVWEWEIGSSVGDIVENLYH